MFTRIEAIDTDTGKTTLNLALDSSNELALFMHRDTTLDENTTITIGRALSFAAHIWDSLVWRQTDAGPRCEIKYGRYKVWLYR